MIQYWTFNNYEGTSYSGGNLREAIENALSHFGDGYIHCEKGKRPVIECYADNQGNNYYVIGEFGESLDELEARITIDPDQEINNNLSTMFFYNYIGGFSMNIYQVGTMDDLKSIADERDIPINWDSPTWAIVSALTEDHEYKWVKPGNQAEFLRMACRIAVTNCDPNYKGYTPFGDIL